MLALTARLRTSARLGVLVVVLLIPTIVATASFSSAVGSQIAFADSESGGLVVLTPALDLLVATTAGQQPDLAPLTEAASHYPALAKSMDKVTAAAAGATTPQGRVVLASSLVDLITDVGNTSKLILDPDLDSFYVMDAQIVQLPKMLLATMQVKAPEAGLSGDARIAARAVLAGTLAGAGGALSSDVDTAIQNTSLASLKTQIDPLNTAASAANNLSKTLTDHLASTAAVDTTGVTAAAQNRDSVAALDQLLHRRIDKLSSSRVHTLAVTLLGLLFAIWVAAAVWWRTRRDVALAVTGVTALATHDLSPQLLPDGRDEMGDIGRAVELARAELAEQDAALRHAQEESAAQQRDHFRAQKIAEREARNRAQTMIDQTAHTVISELNAVLAQVGEVNESAAGIDRNVSDVEAVAKSVVKRAADADKMVLALGESLTKVASIAEMINRVAEQTKLLSLNATIEAARAGEHGLGFGVVANEVKQLASTTATSTGEIASTIALLEQSATEMSSAITAMSQGVGEVDKANASLSGVAGHQGQLVSRLTERLQEALSNTDSMLTLSDNLERRNADRVPAIGTGLRRDGRGQQSLHLRDISSTGARVQLEGGSSVAIGDIVELEITLDGQPVELRATAIHTNDAGDVGLRFLEPSPQARSIISSYVSDRAESW
jgi:methyl-accepting chemotaxis protein